METFCTNIMSQIKKKTSYGDNFHQEIYFKNAFNIYIIGPHNSYFYIIKVDNNFFNILKLKLHINLLRELFYDFFINSVF